MAEPAAVPIHESLMRRLTTPNDRIYAGVSGFVPFPLDPFLLIRQAIESFTHSGHLWYVNYQ